MSEAHASSPVATYSPTQERTILTVTCLAAFLFFNSFGSIGIALPAIQKQFGPKLWSSPAVFAGAQQFAFACWVPVGLLAIAVAFRSRRARP